MTAPIVAALLASAAWPARAEDPPAPTDPVIAKAQQDEAVAKARTEAANAEKARYEAQAAAARAKLGPLAEWTSTGKVEAGEGAGQLEAELLAAEATQGTADELAGRLCRTLTTGGTCPQAMSAHPGPTLVIVSEDAVPKFDAYDAFKVESAAIEADLAEAMRRAQPEAGGGPAPARNGEGRVGLTGAVTAAVTVANLFRSEYEFSRITLTPDDMVLAKAVAVAVRAKNLANPILIPGLYNASTLDPRNPAVATLAGLALERGKAADALIQIAADLRPRRGESKKSQQARASAWAPAVARLDAAIKRHDDFNTRIRAADDKGVVPLALIAREAHVAGPLEAGGYLLVLKANMAGGSAYSQRNFFTFLGAMPYSVSGGALNSFALFRGQDAQLLDAGVLKRAGPFLKVHEANRRFQSGATKAD